MLIYLVISSLSINKFSWDVDKNGYYNGNIYYNGIKFMRDLEISNYANQIQNNPEDINGVIFTTNITKVPNEDAIFYDINILNYQADPIYSGISISFYPCYNDDAISGLTNHIGVNKGWIYTNDQQNFAISFIGKNLQLDNNYYEPNKMSNMPFIGENVYNEWDSNVRKYFGWASNKFNDTLPWPPSYGKLVITWDSQYLYPFQSTTLRFKILSTDLIEPAPKLSEASMKTKGNQVGDTVNINFTVSGCKNGQVVKLYKITDSIVGGTEFLTSKTLFVVDSNPTNVNIPFYCENEGSYKFQIIAVSDLSPYSNPISINIDVGNNPKVFDYYLDKNTVFPFNGFITPRVIGHSTRITQFCFKDIYDSENCRDFLTEDVEKDFNLSIDINLALESRQIIPVGTNNFTFYLKDSIGLTSEPCNIEITVSNKLSAPYVKYIDGSFLKIGRNDVTFQVFFPKHWAGNDCLY